jgi:hypothetical protein
MEHAKVLGLLDWLVRHVEGLNDQRRSDAGAPFEDQVIVFIGSHRPLKVALIVAAAVGATWPS